MKLIILTVSAFFLTTITVAAQQIKGTYAIKNIKTGMLLRLKDAINKNGTPLVAYYPENWKCMTWDFMVSGGENTYQLKNLFTNKTFQPAGVAKAGIGFEEQPMETNSAAQQYEFIKVKGNIYLIRLKNTVLYLTPSDSGGQVNSAIILSAKNGQDSQQWEIYLQNPTM